MKINKIRTALIALFLSALLAAAPAFAVSFTDAMGRAVEVESPRRVVSLYGSYGDVWLTAGGTLAGATQDVMEAGDPRLAGAQNIGSHHTPNAELLLSLDPDFVLLSADMSSHVEIAQMLDGAGIPAPSSPPRIIARTWR